MKDISVFDLTKIQDAYAKQQMSYGKNVNETLGDIVNAGLRTMANGSPMVTAPYKSGTNDIKSGSEINQELKNTALGGTVGLAVGTNPALAAKLTPLAIGAADYYAQNKAAHDNSLPNNPSAAATKLNDELIAAQKEAERTGKSVSDILQSKNNGGNSTDLMKLKADAEKYVNSHPLKLTDREIENPVLRDAVTNSSRMPLVGSVTDFVNNLDRLQKDNPNQTLSNIGTAAKSSLPIYRWSHEQPQNKPIETPKAEPVKATDMVQTTDNGQSVALPPEE